MRTFYLLFFFLSTFASAGSFVPFWDDFKTNSVSKVEAITPEFTVSSIRRGSDDGFFTSTSDAGIITLQLKNDLAMQQGHTFKIVEGAFEDQLFPTNAIKPTEFADNKGQYRFIWFDGNSDTQEPFKIKVKIVGVSPSGDLSEPQFLTIAHEGVKKPWWKFW